MLETRYWSIEAFGLTQYSHSYIQLDEVVVEQEQFKNIWKRHWVSIFCLSRQETIAVRFFWGIDTCLNLCIFLSGALDPFVRVCLDLSNLQDNVPCDLNFIS